MTCKSFGAASTILLLACVVAGAAPSPPVPASMVSPQWVALHTGEPELRILDVRANPHDYFVAHVPNAVNLSDSSLRGPCEGIPAQYQAPGTLAAILSRAGVRQSDRVVVYSDGADVLGATLVAYALERLGHPEVMVMDGGWSAYREAGLRTSQDYPAYDEGSLPALDNTSIRVNLDEVRALLGQRDATFIDARPAEEYSGRVDTWIRNGHIPGALNIDWHLLVREDNPHAFRSAEELRSLYEVRTIFRKDDIILYCGTGREATLHYFVLKHVLGYPRVRLYEGSWKEYAAHEELPVEADYPRIASD